jgi:hypothetical protein
MVETVFFLVGRHKLRNRVISLEVVIVVRALYAAETHPKPVYRSHFPVRVSGAGTAT